MANDKSGRKITPRRALLAAAGLVVAALGLKFFVFSHAFLYAGTLEATKVDLSARLSSAIAEVKVQEGDHVAANQELVRLLCDDVKVAADLATTNFNRNERLFKGGTVSPENMDQIKNRKDDADVRLSWCSIQSPISGTVLSRYHEPGEWVVPGTKLLTLADIRNIWAYVYVPQPEVARLKPGEKLNAYLPELNRRLFVGHILKINDEAEFTPKNVQTEAERSRLVFGVKVSFQGVNDDEILKPGMTIEIELPRE